MSTIKIHNKVQKNKFLALYPLSKRRKSYEKNFNAQLKNSSKRDWTEQVKRDLKELNIHMSFEEIKSMSKNSFKKYVKNKIEIEALKYLKSKIKSIGKELKYKNIEMSEYLKADNNLTLKEKYLN